MPHESMPQATGMLSTEAVAALREALRRRLRAEYSDGDLRDALHRLTAEARGKGLHAEQVIIVLKRVWGELPKTSGPLKPDEEHGMLVRLVTLCIDEYYAGE